MVITEYGVLVAENQGLDGRELRGIFGGSSILTRYAFEDEIIGNTATVDFREDF